MGEDSSALAYDAVRDAPEAILDSGFIAFHVESIEIKSAPHTVESNWTAFFKSDQSQFYIAGPSAISSSSRQSLVSLLELAESLNCTMLDSELGAANIDAGIKRSRHKLVGRTETQRHTPITGRQAHWWHTNDLPFQKCK